VELEIQRPFLYALIPALVNKFASQFPELAEQQDTITSVIRAEEESFGKTVERGLALFREEETRLKHKAEHHLAGDFIFKLYDTYGFPLDLTELLARESGLTLDRDGFERAMEEQRQRSQAAQKRTVIEVNQQHTQSFTTQFIGYDQWQGEGKVLDTGIEPPYIVLTETPCYAEMGGQVGDQGTLYFEDQTYRILDTRKTKEGVVLHILDRPFEAPQGTSVCLQIDRVRRNRIAAHHTTTHLLHWALRKVLGNRVTQRGSYVGPDRLRFDFSHGTAMSPEEIRRVEQLVQEKIMANDPITTSNQLYHKVKYDTTILQFFGEKYGDEVRVVDIGGYSKELCGGTHLDSTREAGFFKILSESAIAAGIRRIEAACGQGITEYAQTEWQRLSSEMRALCEKYHLSYPQAWPPKPQSGSDPAIAWEIFQQAKSILESLSEKGRELAKQEAKARESMFLQQATEVYQRLSRQAKILPDGTAVITADLSAMEHPSAALLPHIADVFKQKNWEGVLILGITDGPKASLLVFVSKALKSRFVAGKIIQQIAPIIGGKGGGRPDLAQGGGTKPEALKEALSKAQELLR
jgi:alanyl-tRNA synthetase